MPGGVHELLTALRTLASGPSDLRAIEAFTKRLAELD